jgi:hypothetical protein
MSTQISISLIADKEDNLTAFEGLVSRIGLNADSMVVARHDVNYSWQDRKILIEGDAGIIRDFSFLDAAQDVAQSRNALEVSCAYRMPSGRIAALDLYFYGDSFLSGKMCRSVGRISLLTTINDLVAPLLEAIRSGIPETSPALDSIRRACLLDVEDVFFTACGFICNASPGVIKHGSMYVERNWRSPLDCSMVYHRDLSEFTRDLLRIYADYHFGIDIVDTFVIDADVLQVESKVSGNRTPGKVEPDRYLYFDESGWILRFLEGLDLTRIKSLQEVPREAIAECLRTAPLAEDHVYFREASGLGGAVTTYPRFGLYPPYYSLYTGLV